MPEPWPSETERPIETLIVSTYHSNGELLGEFCTDDHADGRMDPGWARVRVAFIVVSLLALWGTIDLVLRMVAWWWS